MPELTVRLQGSPLSRDQLGQVARLHRAEVSEGFLSSLGEPVLRMLYEHIASSRRCGLFVAYAGPDTDQPIGYICGTVDASALYREFLVHRWWVALPTLVPKLLSPSRIRRALETLRYPRHADVELPRAEIINFVVAPVARGRGVAAALFGCLMEWFDAQGCAAVKIVTGEQQVRGHGLYTKVGAQLCGYTSIHRGTLSRVYVYRLTDAGKV